MYVWCIYLYIHVAAWQTCIHLAGNCAPFVWWTFSWKWDGLPRLGPRQFGLFLSHAPMVQGLYWPIRWGEEERRYWGNRWIVDSMSRSSGGLWSNHQHEYLHSTWNFHLKRNMTFRMAMNGKNSGAHLVPCCKGFLHSSQAVLKSSQVSEMFTFRCSFSSGHYCVPLSFWQAFCGVSWCRKCVLLASFIHVIYSWYQILSNRFGHARYFIHAYDTVRDVLFVFFCVYFLLSLLTTQIPMFSIGFISKMLTGLPSRKSCRTEPPPPSNEQRAPLKILQKWFKWAW